MALLSSCLKDAAHYTDFSNVGNLVELPLAEANGAGTGGIIHTFAATSTHTSDTLTVAVNLASPKVLSTPTTVTISTTDVTIMNANQPINGDDANGDPLPNSVLLPSSDYTILTPTITIPAGQRLAYFKVTINGSAIGIANSLNYALPITIESASQPVALPYKGLVYAIAIKNIYDGTYSVNGTAVRLPVVAGDPLAGNFSGLGYTQELSTVSTYSNAFAPIWANGSNAGGVSGTTLTINPANNAVTVSSTGNPTLANTPGYNNRYDPTTKTYYISYTWSNGNRAETDTLTYLHP